ncbi:hypothetical protein JXA27_09835 [Aerococcaceae bacterium zg-B36]|uniref:hypothetical protein n=1 Tax=Aerococcaceae bacterium zg-252 TaxID=2796928 RepID=UPI001BD8EA66|nr:hypothetical protein [Aerococcaceae bacterium zg-B36]
MKINKTYIVMRNRKNGYFLANYSNKEYMLAYQAEWVDDVRGALMLSLDYYEKDKRVYNSLAEAFEAEIIKVEAEYTVSEINASEVRGITLDANKISGTERAFSAKTITNPMVNELAGRVATLDTKLDKTTAELKEMISHLQHERY